MGSRICVTSIPNTPAEYQSGWSCTHAFLTTDETFVNTPVQTPGPESAAQGLEQTRLGDRKETQVRGSV